MIPSMTRYAAALLFLLTALFAAAPSVANAQTGGGAALTLTVPPGAAVGDTVELQAVLLVAGNPQADAEIIFFRSASFLNNGSDVEVGRVRTDLAGMAAVTYVPRSEGDVLITAEFAGIPGVRGTFTDSTITIGPGPAQYSQEVGIKVPGINVSLLVAILGAVWVTYMFVMYLVWRIARDGSESPVSGGVTGE